MARMLYDMRHTLGMSFVITRREVKDQFRDWRIIFPILILTLFFPALMNITARVAVRFVSNYGAPLVADRLIPFLLMIVGFFPISVSLVIALESFVGEKERHSIEPLLSSPLSDAQLYIGKLTAAVVTPLLASYLGICVYLIGVYRQVGWVPEPILITQILLLTTVQAVVMVSAAVVISAQTTSVRAANLLASFVIIPMAILIQGESIVMFWARYTVLWWVIAGLVVVAILFIRAGMAHFSREELLGKDLDNLNFGWGIKIFFNEVSAGARSIKSWYQRMWKLFSEKLWLPIGLASLSLLMGLWVGASQAKVFVLPPELINFDSLESGLIQGPEIMQFYSAAGVATVWLHNIRAVLLATALGLFSFGVLGIIVLMLPLVLVGYFLATVANAGISPLTFLTAFVLPHGILEIPAIIIAGAVILRLGATLASPTPGQTVGEAFLRALADWFKVLIGVVIPLLLGAALLEVYVTPQVIMAIYGR
jgi:uncharacterized membrane protein SpoIIM required for sporulation/ABC-type transport system involved in multi-copper enzyme maturation permease subunit